MGKAVISEGIVQEKDMIREEIDEIKLENIFGEIVKTNQKTKALIEINGVMVNTDFLIAKTKLGNEILIGKETLKEIENKRKELEILKGKFPKVFDGKASEGYPDYDANLKQSQERKYT